MRRPLGHSGTRLLDQRPHGDQHYNRCDGLLVSYWGFRFGVFGVYVSGRTREKLSLATGQDTPGVLDKLINKVVKKK